MVIDKIFMRNSSWVWNNLRESRKYGLQLGEESITDFLILNLKKLAGKKLIVESFTKPKESLNGSDWEWWFTGPSGKWLGMRIQAKVLNLTSEKYEHLHHHNKNGQQVDLLIKDAFKSRMIPAYCMFTNWDPAKYSTPKKCNTHKASVRHYGTAILSTKKVKEYRTSKVTHLSKIINDLRPMHCIFCCSAYGGSDLPSRALGYARAAGLLDSIEGKYDLFLQDAPPRYVLKILEHNLHDEFLDDQRLRTITIFKEVE